MDGAEHLDELDRRIVIALQGNGRASWTEIAEQCGSSVATVARRGQQLLRDGVVRVAVMPDIQHGGESDLFILRITCAPGTQTRVLGALSRRTDMRFLSLVTGAYDILAELNVRKEDSLHTRIVNEIQAIDGVERCNTDLTLNTYKVAHDWSQQFGVGPDVKRAVEVHRCAPSHFDPADHKIIELMAEDGRASFRSVAATLGVNESTVRRRFETLQGRGCIHLVTLVPAPALGYESEIILDISVAPALLDSVARKLAAYRGVRYVAATLSHNALMCELILPTTQDVFEFTNGTLGRLDGVLGWTASVVLLVVRRGFVETPWWRKGISVPALGELPEAAEASAELSGVGVAPSDGPAAAPSSDASPSLDGLVAPFGDSLVVSPLTGALPSAAPVKASAGDARASRAGTPAAGSGGRARVRGR
jgi:DNA-binding Lrp family transcriptional regulator